MEEKKRGGSAVGRRDGRNPWEKGAQAPFGKKKERRGERAGP